MNCSMPGFPVLHYLPEFAQTHVHLILCWPLLLLPLIFPKSRVFSNESILQSGGQNIGASASSSALPKNIQDFSFRIDCFDLLTVQGILKSLLQHHISKTSMLWCSAFFMVQLSHPYMTIGKAIALTAPSPAKSCLCFLICCPGLL